MIQVIGSIKISPANGRMSTCRASINQGIFHQRVPGRLAETDGIILPSPVNVNPAQHPVVPIHPKINFPFQEYVVAGVGSDRPTIILAIELIGGIRRYHQVFRVCSGIHNDIHWIGIWIIVA